MNIQELENKVKKLEADCDTLQRMNKNAASQAVAEYQHGLKSALQNVYDSYDDPEIKSDPEAMSAILEHVFDVLRWKGVDFTS